MLLLRRKKLFIFEVDDFDDPNILATIWQILDDQRKELQVLGKAYKSWETARRKHGESMNTWIIHLKKIELELEAQDP